MLLNHRVPWFSSVNTQPFTADFRSDSSPFVPVEIPTVSSRARSKVRHALSGLSPACQLI